MTAPTVLERVSRAALDLLFPPQCALCRRGGAMLCEDCAAELPPAAGRRCPRCWMPQPSGGLFCGHCRGAPPAFKSLRAAYVMDGGARRLVHAFKYDGMSALASVMAGHMRGRLDVGEGDDVVVPVPLHRGRERSRGYNQAALLARELARAAGLPFDARAARRVRATAPLVKAMSRDERHAIMRGAFAARAERVEGRHILLVDDVVTTGATLDACAGVLRASGAASVRCVTWARAD